MTGKNFDESDFFIFPQCAMWTFQYFSATQILREIKVNKSGDLKNDFCIVQILCEINFEDSGSAKSAISTHLQAMNSAFHVFYAF